MNLVPGTVGTAGRAAPRLGELLVRAGLLSPPQLERALAEQASRNRKLGELLVQMGVVDGFELDAVLALQEDVQSGRLEPLVRSLQGRLGAILLSSSAVDAGQLERAMREQARSGGLLGDILVQQGALDRRALEGALAFQRSLPRPKVERLRIGRMLVDGGVISQSVLDEAIERQRRSGKRLGEALVESGAVAPDVLAAFLQRQRRLLAAAMAAVALSAPAVGSPAHAADAARLRVEVQVLSQISIGAVRIPDALTIGPADLARGYVDLDQPVEVDVRTNHPRGAMLGFSVNSSALRSVRVQESRGADLSAGGASVRVAKEGAGLRTQTVSVRVRLELARDATPGTIARPLAVFVAPL